MSKEQTNLKTKYLAIKYYLKNDVSHKEVSKIFNINERTFRRWLEKFDNKELDRPQSEKEALRICFETIE